MGDTEKKFCDCFTAQLTVLINNLYTMTQTYRLLVGGAEEFSRIGLADKHDKKEAIDRAEDMGDVIDKVIKKLDDLVKIQVTTCSPKRVCLLEQQSELEDLQECEFSELKTEVEKDLGPPDISDIENEIETELSPPASSSNQT